mmetsp:Transcript_25122/g.43361  ORF Transcript_25122/g.43361 Transcript_25122/m.43361 type:complete len:125 (-) Transcript_25122:209-583(-)
MLRLLAADPSALSNAALHRCSRCSRCVWRRQACWNPCCAPCFHIHSFSSVLLMSRRIAPLSYTPLGLLYLVPLRAAQCVAAARLAAVLFRASSGSRPPSSLTCLPCPVLTCMLRTPLICFLDLP